MPLNSLASWLGFMFEAICLPHAWKVTGLNVGSHITQVVLMFPMKVKMNWFISKIKCLL